MPAMQSNLARKPARSIARAVSPRTKVRVARHAMEATAERLAQSAVAHALNTLCDVAAEAKYRGNTAHMVQIYLSAMRAQLARLSHFEDTRS